MLPKDHPCNGCSLCCRHVSIPIDTPDDKDDWNNILWYVLHENIVVYRDDEGEWYIEFKTPCKALDKNGLCSIHKERPTICRDYSYDSCEKHGEGDYWDIIFRTPDEVKEYVYLHTKIKELTPRE